MSRRVVGGMVLVLACAAPVVASADGLNFAWNDTFGCWSEAGSSNIRAFACNTNTGGHVAVGSFSLGEAMADFVAVEVTVDLLANSSTLPDWWQLFYAGACRQTALTASSDFTGAPGTVCVDPWQGLAGGGIASYATATTTPPSPFGLPNAARLRMAFALAKSVPLEASVEYYAFRFRVGDAKSVGTGACAGCSVPMCLLLNSLNVVGATLGEQRIVSQPLVNNMIYFNSGSTAPCIVPTRATTWGAVKSLYR